MNKSIFILLFALAGVSVSCEKSDWFSPEDVDLIRSDYQAQINALTISKNELTTQTTSLTTQIDDLNATVTTLGVTSNDQVAEIATLTTSVTTLTDQIVTLDAEIVTLNATITATGSTTTDLNTQITTLTTTVASLTAQAVTLQASIDAAAADVLTLQQFKDLRSKVDTMVAATISDAKLNTAIDSVSIGLTSTSLTPATLKGLITAESNWVFNNAVKSGTVSMTTAASSFYDTSTDTNVVNFRTLVTEMTTAWNAAKESQFILWWIEFIKEFENL
jgi:phage host-nuclease inhibitor protein Gam